MSRYRGSDGRRYADRDIWERLESAAWRVCCWDEDTGLEVVETEAEELLFLVPTGRGDAEFDEGERSVEHTD